MRDGASVWGGDTGAYIESTVSDSWTVRASGDVRFFANSTASAQRVAFDPKFVVNS